MITDQTQPLPATAEAAPLPRASVVIVNTNELHHLKQCLPTIAEQDYPDGEVIVVDNCSTDGSIDYLKREFPWVRVVRSPANLGYAGAGNLGFAHATGEYVAIMNPDTQVEPGWLRELVQALQHNPQAGLATPKILLMHDPTRLNTCGNDITLTGLTFCRGLDEPADQYMQPEVVSAVSGAAFVVKRHVMEQIGGFDDHFFIYFEETDLSLRAMLAGYTCLYVPTARIRHQYTFKFSPRKCFYQERNRYLALLKVFHWQTLLLLLPLFLLSECIVWGYVLLHGAAHIRGKIASYGWLIGNWWYVLQARRRAQAFRRVADHMLLARFHHRLNFARTAQRWQVLLLDHSINPLLRLIGQVLRARVTW